MLIFQFPRKFVKYRFGLKIKISHLIHSTNKPSTWSNFHFPRWITRFENQTTSSYCLFYDFQDCVDRSNVLHNCRTHLSNVHKMTETFAQPADYVEHYESHTIQLNLITPPPTSRRSRKREKLLLTLKGYIYGIFSYPWNMYLQSPVQPTQAKTVVELLFHFLTANTPVFSKFC